MLIRPRVDPSDLCGAGDADIFPILSKLVINPSRFRHIDDIVVRRPDGSLWAVLNEDGRIAPVLHQYDRMPWLTAALEGRYIRP